MSKRVKIAGKKYALVVLRVKEFDEKGRPSMVMVGYDDTVFRVDDEKQSNDFYTCLVPEEMLKTSSIN
jgi:hypothetical protein